jgi:hypothetical protein
VIGADSTNDEVDVVDEGIEIGLVVRDDPYQAARLGNGVEQRP